MSKYLYSGYAIDLTNPQTVININPTADSLYSVQEIPIVKKDERGIIEVKGSWCLSPLVSTSHFTLSDLDKSHKLIYGFVYYSEDKSKCEDFVKEWQKRNAEFIDKINNFDFI